MLSHVFGILFIFFGISGFVLGIVSLGIRRKATHYEPENKLIKRIYILAILGIILGVIGTYFGGALFFIPFHLEKFYNLTFLDLFPFLYIWRRY
jgi:hypothetical protein